MHFRYKWCDRDECDKRTSEVSWLHAGQEGLCTSFHSVHDPEHFLHAPVRQFYQQALQLFFEAPTLLLKLWHSLACGHDNAGKVPNSAVHHASRFTISCYSQHCCQGATLPKSITGLSI